MHSENATVKRCLFSVPLHDLNVNIEIFQKESALKGYTKKPPLPMAVFWLSPCYSKLPAVHARAVPTCFQKHSDNKPRQKRPLWGQA
ncbi:MAG: hypothetical protein CSB23_01085 [Deltaproteobacteria bacterium]|nr:MAG: hypothetical protein CSB23_01085 [Deltaproteobacteria bacterium]